MAGQPGYVALERRLAKVSDEVFQLIADGLPMREVAVRFGTSRTQLYRWIAADGNRKTALSQARRYAATSHVEDALAALDAATTATQAHVAREQAAMRRWLAERWDRDTFGSQSLTPVISIGELHLAALRTLIPSSTDASGDPLPLPVASDTPPVGGKMSA